MSADVKVVRNDPSHMNRGHHAECHHCAFIGLPAPSYGHAYNESRQHERTHNCGDNTHARTR